MNGAEVGGAAADFETGEDSTVFFLTFFFFQSVNIKHILIFSLIAERVAVVGVRSASRLNRFL